MQKQIKIDDEVIQGGDIITIITPVWYGIDIYNDKLSYNKSKACFSREQIHVFAVMWYQAEVNNGGHGQFMCNSTGIVWEDALMGLKEMMALSFYNILNDACKLFGGKPEFNRPARLRQLEDNNPFFDDLDCRFYECGSLFETMLSYINKHRSSFYYDGLVDFPF